MVTPNMLNFFRILTDDVQVKKKSRGPNKITVKPGGPLAEKDAVPFVHYIIMEPIAIRLDDGRIVTAQIHQSVPPPPPEEPDEEKEEGKEEGKDEEEDEAKEEEGEEEGPRRRR